MHQLRACLDIGGERLGFLTAQVTEPGSIAGGQGGGSGFEQDFASGLGEVGVKPEGDHAVTLKATDL